MKAKNETRSSATGKHGMHSELGTLHDLRAQIQAADSTKENWLLDLAADHESSMIRRSALVALRTLKSKKAWPILLSILATDHTNQNLRETAIKTLGDIGGEESLTILRRILQSEEIAKFGKQAAAKAIHRLEARIANSISAESTKEDSSEYRDLFLSYAREDRATIIDPLLEALHRIQISWWLDSENIRAGDSITEKVNDGLKKSKYVLAILSPSFMAKNWPRRELNAILNLEATTGVVKLLALLTGTSEQKLRVLREFPLLNDKLYLEWRDNPDAIAQDLKERLTPGQPRTKSTDATTALHSLRELGNDLQTRKENFSRRIKCQDAAKYLKDIAMTLRRMVATIANGHVPHDELAALRTHAKLLPEALKKTLTLMEANDLVAQLSRIADSDFTTPATAADRDSALADLSSVAGMFDALGSACRVNYVS